MKGEALLYQTDIKMQDHENVRMSKVVTDAVTSDDTQLEEGSNGWAGGEGRDPNGKALALQDGQDCLPPRPDDHLYPELLLSRVTFAPS